MIESQIIITSDIEATISDIKRDLNPHSVKIIYSDEFKIDDSKDAIKEAYISSSDKKYIFLGAKKFNIYAQNSLLKILEEPPKNIIFIIVTNSKSALLSTIKSRLKVVVLKEKREARNLNLNINSKEELLDFLIKNQRVDKIKAKELLQEIFQIVFEMELKLTEKELNIFSNSFKLLELNSRPINILTTVVFILISKRS
jgi:DNA polymerase-3 subunit delta'